MFLKSKHLQTFQSKIPVFKSLKSCDIGVQTPLKLSNKPLNAQNIQIKYFKSVNTSKPFK